MPKFYKLTLGLLLVMLAACETLPTPSTEPAPILAPSPTLIPTQIIATEPPVLSPAVTEARSFTMPHPLLGDLRIRQGIAYCTNRPELVHAVYPWLEDPATLVADSFIVHNHWAYPQDDSILTHYPYDPEKGQMLFKEAGWTLNAGADYRTNVNGEEMAIKLTTTDAAFRKTWATVFEEQMKACGLQVVRFHVPAAWFFGNITGLARRDFEVAAFAWVNEPDPGGRTLYTCEAIPSPDNGWRGQNLSGWCNEKADAAIRTATSTLSREAQQKQYAIVQAEYTQDLPGLPLFHRVSVMAINPALENLSFDSGEGMYTWNAARWFIPGRDTLLLGKTDEPSSLSPAESAYTAQVLRALITGVDYVNLNYDYQPVMLKQIPTIENGGAVNNLVEVKEGDRAVDANGEIVELKSGVKLRDAEGKEVEYVGGAAQLPQLTVTFEFVDGLTWSDGTPTSKADYELGYRLTCDPETAVPGFETPLACSMVASVDFIGDTAYRVIYLPGYQAPLYFLPPFTRQPAHQTISDGRTLAEVPTSQWGFIEDALSHPMGVGPYVLSHWDYGQQMVFTANPYYYLGPPTTPTIIARFLPDADSAVAKLIAGEVDVLDLDTLGPEQAPLLLEVQQTGKAHLLVVPSSTWEHLEFALRVR